MAESLSPSNFEFKDYLAQGTEYIEWAQQQVKVLPQDKFNEWMLKEKGQIVLNASGWFINRYHPNGSIGFVSVINSSSFIIEGTDYTDLIPYAIEHEVQESYAKILARKALLSTGDPHKIAMEKEFALAAKDGKQDRLYQFMCLFSPRLKDQFQNAYDLVKKT